jgi:hypothetical protein
MKVQPVQDANFFGTSALQVSGKLVTPPVVM